MCGRDYAGRLTAAHNQARRLAAGPTAGTTVYIIAWYWGTAAAQYGERRLPEDPDELWRLVRTSARPGPAGWGFHTGRRVGAEGWLRVGVGGTKGAAEVQAFPPSAIRCSAAGGAGATLRPWQTVFRAAGGAGAFLRPGQPLFHAAGGTGARLCPGRAHYLRLRRFSSARKASALAGKSSTRRAEPSSV